MSAAPSILRRWRWYAARLAAMPAREIPHRLAEAGRKRRWRRDDRRWNGFASISDGPLADLRLLRERLRRACLDDGAGRAAVSRQRTLAGEFQFLGTDWPRAPVSPHETTLSFQGTDLAPAAAIWFHDPVTGKKWPGAEQSCFDIDVRSTGAHLGDVKYVWELNRLQVLHPLALAIAHGDDGEARAAALSILASWTDANPPYRGVNWVSGVELAMRLVSFSLIVAATGPENLAPSERTLIRRLVAAHGRYLLAFPSLYSSANNHRLAEGLGLLIAGMLLPDLPEARIWKREGRQVLEAETHRQILSDGVGVEQSPTYQAFAMEMVAYAGLLAQDTGEPLAPALIERLVEGAGFLLWLADDHGRVPSIGDDDEGRVLAQPPDREPRYVASVIAAVAGLAQRPDLAPAAREAHLRNRLFDSPPISGTGQLRSGLQVFGGYTCAKETIAGRRCHIIFDHGPLGFDPLCAHGHADALAIWLTIDDQPVFIDAGTYLYFSGIETRTRLRESPAHNTLAIAGRSQSKAQQGFSWARRTNARLLHVAPGPPWAATAAHDGYDRRFCARHVRRVERTSSGYAIMDALEGARRPLPVTLNFLCHPDLQIQPIGSRIAEIIGSAHVLCSITAPRDFAIHIERGHSQPEGNAHYSGAFGHIAPTTQLVLAGTLGSQPRTTLIAVAGRQAASGRRATTATGAGTRQASPLRRTLVGSEGRAIERVQQES